MTAKEPTRQLKTHFVGLAVAESTVSSAVTGVCYTLKKASKRMTILEQARKKLIIFISLSNLQ